MEANLAINTKMWLFESEVIDSGRHEIRHHRIPDLPEIPECGATTWEEVMPLRPRNKGGITSILYENGYVEARGAGYCSHQENYNKEKGRSIALGRLLRNLWIFWGVECVKDAYLYFYRLETKFDWGIVKKAYLGEKIE